MDPVVCGAQVISAWQSIVGRNVAPYDTAVISVTAGVVEPRYPSFKGIMAAKSKPIDTVTAGDLGVTPVGWAGANQSVVSVTQAEARAAGEIIEDDGEAFAKIVDFLENLKVI